MFNLWLRVEKRGIMKLSLVSNDHPSLRQKAENFDFDSPGIYDPKE